MASMGHHRGSNELQLRKEMSAPKANGVGRGDEVESIDGETSALNSNLKVYKLNPRMNSMAFPIF